MTALSNISRAVRRTGTRQLPARQIQSLLAILVLLWPAAMLAQNDIREHTLSNGMKVWLDPDTTASKIFGAVVVNAGAIHTPDTGIAHYLEHMAFKGSTHIGTLDYTKEKPLLDSIKVLYDKLPAAVTSAQKDSILKAINRLSVKSAEYVIPNEFSHLISRYGGTSLNAFTSDENTVYHSYFTPQYLEQWCMLNAERLVNPVFRLFQSELETVYEEKNMSEDDFMSAAMDHLMKRSYAPSPYMYTILGSSENLKNPSLTQMEAFYKKYYTAGNMSLLLSGNFNPDKALPVIEKTFSAIPAGAPHTDSISQPAALQGKEHFKVKVPIPFVNGTLLGWHTVSQVHPDYLKIAMIARLLSNEQQTGLIDRLVAEGEIMMGFSSNIAGRNLGIFGAIAIAKPIIQSKKGAEKKLMKTIAALKSGDFPDDLLASVKQSMLLDYYYTLETSENRSWQLVDQLSNKQSYELLFHRAEAIKEITKADIVAVANRYFTADYLAVTKTTGKYKKEYLPKPNLVPVKPENKRHSSEYAKRLEQVPVPDISPKFLSFASPVRIAPLAELYTTANTVNHLFELKLTFARGLLQERALQPLAEYLEKTGCLSFSFKELADTLSKLGIVYSFKAQNNSFDIMFRGPEEQMPAAFNLISSLIYHPAASPKELRKLVKIYALDEKAGNKTLSNIAGALFQKIAYADSSRYVRSIKAKELARYTHADLQKILEPVLKSQLAVHYFGNRPADSLIQLIQKNIRLEEITEPAGKIYYAPLHRYPRPRVYLVDMPKSKQAYIYSYQAGKPVLTMEEARQLETAGQYIGGGMTSLLFQQVREMHSLAYGTSGVVVVPPPTHTGQPAALACVLSTQTDKAGQAMQLLDSLLKNMPLDSTVAVSALQNQINAIYNNYPVPRQISYLTAFYKRMGYNEDPNWLYYQEKDNVTVSSILQAYKEAFQDAPIIYMITGDLKKMDIEAFRDYGEIIIKKKPSLFKKGYNCSE